MVSHEDIPAIIIVGIMWGCTNPFMRNGAKDYKQAPAAPPAPPAGDNDERNQDHHPIIGNSDSKSNKRHNPSTTTTIDHPKSSTNVADETNKPTTTTTNEPSSSSSFFAGITRTLLEFRRPGVFLPYLLNQSGSLLYYKLAATADMTTAVPACNALAMVFSSLTSYLLGERLDKPGRAFAGALLVSLGVIICMVATEDVFSDNDSSSSSSSPTTRRTQVDEL
eukprot:CAMPEP_0198251246 /NCGR_PEP_ID=MMETSP1447-20131203/2139_1 /TAXON_ID=420782 /ORGANISM="Chaetoceros dichaeta, Strain CCMP1751" /LENGTH=221 /DNA_ID=CAMNT_0043936221 /DNA_START=37 /DNA_END=702 /DNA_ORIENTATION=+